MAPTDELMQGKSYYPLLISLSQSIPVTVEETEKEQKMSWRKDSQENK